MDSIRLQKLKESPMFQLSLGSKELFHSNFLYWLWKAEPDAFWKIMSGFNIIQEDGMEVYREKNNFDFSIYNKDGYVVAVIENKVKSVPDKVQLEGYDSKIKKILKNKPDKIEKNKRILLSLMEPDFNDSGWKRWSYWEYLQILNNLEIKDKYHANIVDDYRNMIEELVELKEEWVGDEEKIMSMIYMDITNPENSKLAVELRINDLRQKMIFSKMFSILEQELGKKLGKENLKKGKTVEQILSETKTEEIKLAIGFGMTNATGFIDIKVNIENKYILGIQLQGDQYRHYIEYGKEPTQEPNLNKFKDLFNHGDIYSTKSNKICSFKNKNKEKTFYYVYQNKDDSVCRKTIGDVINQIVADVEYLMKKY